MSGFISSPYILSAPPPPAVGGAALIVGETDAMGIDFTYATDVTKQMRVTTGGAAVDSAPYTNLTYASPSLKMTRQSDGVWRYVNHNLLTRSETFDHGDWNPSNVGVTANATTAPDGTSTADYITASGTGSTRHELQNVRSVGVSGARFKLSYYVKKADYDYAYISIYDIPTNPTFTFFNINSGTVGTTYSGDTASIASAGGGWYRISVERTVGDADLYITVGFCAADNTATFAATTGQGMYAWGAQLKRTPVNDALGFTYATGYLATTSAAVYDLPYEWDVSNASQGILIEEARTNLAVRSDDFTNASWTKSNMTTAYTSTGPDGVANSASRLTASAGNATALQAITSASAARISSVFAKRITGSGNIDITQDNGSTWTTVAVTSSWTRVECAAATLTNPTVGIRIVTNADAIDVFRFQHEVGSFTTSPIQTVVAAALRNSDDGIQLLTSAFPYAAAGAGTMVTAFYPKLLPSSGNRKVSRLYDPGVGNEIVLYYYDSAGVVTAQITTGGVPQTNAAGTQSVTAAAISKIGIGYATNDVALVVNGVVALTDATASMPSPTALSFGSSGTSGGEEINGYIRQFTYLKRRATNVELQTRTT